MNRLSAALIAAIAASSPFASADVKPAVLFTDHAALQGGMAVPVWGTADAGEHVAVEIDGHKAAADAGADGKWMVKLDPLTPGGPFTMTIEGKNKITLQDVVVGDVWVASGQSNMEYGINNADKAVSAKADDAQLHLFCVPRAGSMTPIDQIKADKPLNGTWVVCTPSNLAQAGDWSGFSAVGYYFGHDLREFTKKPVGIIATHWGGTRAEAWTSIEGFKADPLLAHDITEAASFIKKADVKFPWYWADYGPEKAAWDKKYGNEFAPKKKAWQDAAKAAKAAGQPIPPQPQPPVPEPAEPHFQQAPSVLFNAMVNPLIPYAIKGAIWYQGESNSGKAKEYRTLFPAMIADWRAKWGQGDFPFLFVQIAPFKDMAPEIREAQLMTLTKSPNTGMAVTVDVGDATNIHPIKKQPVGARLALAARGIAYGDKIEYSGPLYESVKFDGDKATLGFTHIGAGLEAKGGTALKGFTIAGKDGKFVPATAEIEGDTVVVHADGVTEPTAVRYGWANVPDVNLFNKDGLPASPFRTDPD